MSAKRVKLWIASKYFTHEQQGPLATFLRNMVGGQGLSGVPYPEISAEDWKGMAGRGAELELVGQRKQLRYSAAVTNVRNDGTRRGPAQAQGAIRRLIGRALTSVRRLATAIGPSCFWPPCLWILMPLPVQLVQGALSQCRGNRLRSARSATAFLCGRRKTAGRAP